ncbi:MAG TPA: hypothetical protein VHL58_13575 [Thermoanaerobaculia bacterium]|nr:hypothetical protein [Thermoanaerobaculia bacterium]
MADDALRPGVHLRYALSVPGERGYRIGCTLAIGILLAAVAIPILILTTREADGRLVGYAAGGGFGAVALLLLYSAIYQTLALATPKTIVETDSVVLTRGAEARFYFLQPGPAVFESLRANLVGEESWWTGHGDRRSRNVRQLGTFNFLDTGPFEVQAAEPYEHMITFSVPDDLPHASGDDHQVTWCIEVWGKVRGRADCQHVFPTQVL